MHITIIIRYLRPLPLLLLLLRVRLAEPHRWHRRGRLLLQAQYFDNPRCAIDLDAIKVREITIRTTCGQDSQDMQDAITNIRTRRVQITPLITHRFDAPGDLLKGYDLLDTGLEFNLGMVFRWGNVDEA